MSRIATIVVVVVLAVHSSIHVQPKLPKCNLASFNEGDVVTKLKKDTVCITNRAGTKCCETIDLQLIPLPGAWPGRLIPLTQASLDLVSERWRA